MSFFCIMEKERILLMPAIKTSEWLKNKMDENSHSSFDLSNLAGLKTSEIESILNGDLGTVQEWKKIFSVYKNLPKISFDCENLIQEVNEEIEISGPNQKVFAYYYVKSDCIIFEDYLLPEDYDPILDSDLKKLNKITLDLKTLLDYLKEQNKII